MFHADIEAENKPLYVCCSCCYGDISQIGSASSSDLSAHDSR